MALPTPSRAGPFGRALARHLLVAGLDASLAPRVDAIASLPLSRVPPPLALVVPLGRSPGTDYHVLRS
jgi:hypothetical protein